MSQTLQKIPFNFNINAVFHGILLVAVLILRQWEAFPPPWKEICRGLNDDLSVFLVGTGGATSILAFYRTPKGDPVPKPEDPEKPGDFNA